MKGLLLDLDDTLIDERQAMMEAFMVFIAAHRDRFPEELEEHLQARWREVTVRHWARFEQGELTLLDQRRERLREFLGQPFTDAEADEAFAPYRIAYLASIRPFPDTLAFLDRTAGLRRVLVTNGDRALQERKLHDTGLTGRFEAMITPQDVAARKPDPRIFQAALARLDLEPAQCAMIGDDQLRDIEPAWKLGLAAFRVDASDPGRTLLKALDELRL